MWFVYVFECMIYVLPSIGGPSEPLNTTNAMPTLQDIIVGWIGWAIILLLILGISLIISYFSKRKAPPKESYLADSNPHNEIKENNINPKFTKRLFYFLECFALCFTCMCGGANRPMKSTNQKPSRKEVIVSLIGWMIIILLVLLIVLLCISL